jgi:sugar lactone lactonase YvrE
VTHLRRGRALGVVLVVLVALLGNSGTGQAQTTRSRWDTRVLSHVAAPGYPAYAYAHPNGRVYAGTYSNPTGDSMRSRVFEWTAHGTLLRSWTVPGQHLDDEHGVQVALSDSRGRLVLLEKSTSRILLLNTRTGRFSRYATLPDLPTCGVSDTKHCSPNAEDKPAIPNYAAWGPHGAMYVSDYGQAVIWRVPPGGGKPRVWFSSRKLDGGEFGTAGLVLAPSHKALLLTQQSSMGLGETNPTSGKLYRLPFRANGKAGSLKLVWESQPGDLPDGFGVAKSGRIYIANAGLSNQIVVIKHDGTELERFPKTPGTGENGSSVPFDTPSSATFLGDRILVANQSYFGNTANHAILDVQVGEPGVPIFIPRRAGEAVAQGRTI